MGSIGQFGKAALYSSLLVMIGEAILAAYSGADPAAMVCCVYVAFGAVMAGVGFAIAACTVAARHVLLRDAARMRSGFACVAAGALYPITVVAMGHVLSMALVDPLTPLAATLMVVALIVVPAVGAGWWMVRKQSPT